MQCTDGVLPINKSSGKANICLFCSDTPLAPKGIRVLKHSLRTSRDTFSRRLRVLKHSLGAGHYTFNPNGLRLLKHGLRPVAIALAPKQLRVLKYGLGADRCTVSL